MAIYKIEDIQSFGYNGIEVYKSHKKALQKADNAFKLKSEKEYEKAQKVFYVAYEYARDAAMLSIEKDAGFYTRSVLLKSAIELAKWAGEYKEAENLRETLKSL